MQKNIKIPYLTVADIAVLTLIFLGVGIVGSTAVFLQDDTLSAGEIVFDSGQNQAGAAYEIVLSAVACVYLKWRKFDFSVLDFSVNRQTLLRIIVYFLSAGTVACIADYSALLWTDEDALYGAGAAETVENPLHAADFSLIVFALLNGFFEEVYFLGLLFAARGFKKRMHRIFLFGLLMRFLLHTYQGLWAAAVVTTLGAVFFALRRKYSQLVPFMLAHSLFDIFGLGLPFYLFYS